jgi:branched-chain amino acid transport system ATP-binding protein
MAALLALQGVSKAFGSLRVIDELTLEVFDREALGVIGPNGAGKTTALNLLIGRLRPRAGRSSLPDATSRTCPRTRAAGRARPHPPDSSSVRAPTVFGTWVGGVFGGGRAEPAYGPRWPRSG